ncbi:MAG: TRAP transporter large permease subunit [Deltaproteobacteria bacterium]|nr:TRAP transporter large permease subunit [Deltaproteobacteria bacterium]
MNGMMSLFETLIKYMVFISRRFSMIIVGIMAIPIFIDVSSRFIFSRSILGVIEIEEFMLVCSIFCMLGFVQYEKGHISIDILVSRLPRSIQELLDVFIYAVSGIIFALISWQTIINAIQKSAERSMALQIPVSIFVGIAAFGSLILALVLARDFLKALGIVLNRKLGIWLIVPLLAAVIFMISPTLFEIISPDISGLSFGLLWMCLLFLLMAIKVPIGFAMALIGFLGLWSLTEDLSAPLMVLGSSPYVQTASFIMAVAPLFIFMGQLSVYLRISEELFDAGSKWLGHLPGGLSMASIIGCAGFAAVCGDSFATALTMTTVALPEMRKRYYEPSLALGGIAAGGTLGILIPPSLGFIFYAIVTEESVGKLFIAGVIPGVLLTVLFIITIYIWVILDPSKAPRGQKFTFREKLVSLKGVIGMLFLFLLILGGILGGLFSPTEGGAIGVVGAVFFGIVTRRISMDVIARATSDTVSITCKLFTVLIGVSILGGFLASSRLPYYLAEFVTGLDLGPYWIFAAIVVLYLLLGCVMNVIPIILLTLPAIYPSVIALGFDPIWFGVVTVILMEMGQITPPVGVVVYTVASVSEDVSVVSVFRGVLPFVICELICVVILTFFPQIALFLPNLFFK